MKLSSTPSSSASPQFKSFRSSKKFLPCVEENKRLSTFLSDCQDFQSSLVKTWKNLYSVSSLNLKKMSKLEKNLDSEVFEQGFKGKYEKMPKNFEGIKKVSSVRQAINSIIKTPKVRNGLTEQKQLVNYDILQTLEARELLKCNKRKFGEHFMEDLKVPDKRKKENPKLRFKEQSKEKSLKKLTLPYSSRPNGTVSQMLFVSKYKNLANEQDKEMIHSVLKEKKRVSQMIKMERMLHQKVIKH